MCQQVCTAQSCGGLTWCDEVSGQCLPGCVRDAQCGTRERCDLPTHTCACQAGTTPCATGCCTTPTCFGGTLTATPFFPPGPAVSGTIDTFAGFPLTLDATYDQQATTAWRITRAPSGSAALIMPIADNAASYAPDVAGAYTVEATGTSASGASSCAPLTLIINAS